MKRQAKADAREYHAVAAHHDAVVKDAMLRSAGLIRQRASDALHLRRFRPTNEVFAICNSQRKIRHLRGQ